MNSTQTMDAMAEPMPKNAAEMKAALEEMYVQAQASFARMEANRVEIDRLRAETRVILDSIHEMMHH